MQGERSRKWYIRFRLPRVGYNIVVAIAPQIFLSFYEVVEVGSLLLYYNVAFLQCIQMKIP